MAKFEFRDELSLEIAGHAFVIRVNSSFKRIMTEYQDKFIKLMKSPETKTMGEAEILVFCEEALDQIFGSGAYKKIFADNRNASVQDVIDILFFITVEINKKAKRTLERDKKKPSKKK